jgi:hypothetical protein
LPAFSVSAFGQCAFPWSAVTSGKSYINFIPLGNEPFFMTDLAADKWSFGCDGVGTAYPQLTVGSYSNYSDTMNVYVIYLTGRSTAPDGRCGYTAESLGDDGQITGAIIKMWQQQADGADCEPTMRNLVAHEIGHVLGLNVVTRYPECNGTIMGNNPDFISTDQCSAVKDTWYTPEEQERDNRVTECAVSCSGGNWCDSAGYCMQCDQSGCYPQTSPIIFNLSSGPFELTSIAGGVSFDLGAVGTPSPTSWTAPGRALAFLCWDRNRNGQIDSGRELFGDRTPMRSGATAANGFDALAEFDTEALGGNDNGYIDAGDQIWTSLRLWVDRNHDGVSQPEELSTLSNAGLTAISLDYKLDQRRDPYGNQFRYRAFAIGTGSVGVSSIRYSVYDVLLQQKRPRQ